MILCKIYGIDYNYQGLILKPIFNFIIKIVYKKIYEFLNYINLTSTLLLRAALGL